MKNPHWSFIVLLLLFCCSALAVAYWHNPYHPLLAIVGEESAGTWLSGILLAMSATMSLTIGMRVGAWPWFYLAIFLLILALDERFMFHEQTKTALLFAFHSKNSSRWVYDVPVLVGACLGVLTLKMLWTHLHKLLLVALSLLGLLSVLFDVLSLGVFWEECFKLLAEFLLVCTLVLKAKSAA